MFEAKEIGGRWRRRSRAEAERLVVEYERSGLTRRSFCEQRGISAGTLDLYRKRRREMEATPPSGAEEAGPRRAVGILPVEWVGGAQSATRAAPETQAGLWVELARGRRIGVSQGFDADLLVRLMAVLERS
jgi:hypothetical protein